MNEWIKLVLEWHATFAWHDQNSSAHSHTHSLSYTDADKWVARFGQIGSKKKIIIISPPVSRVVCQTRRWCQSVCVWEYTAPIVSLRYVNLNVLEGMPMTLPLLWVHNIRIRLQRSRNPILFRWFFVLRQRWPGHFLRHFSFTAVQPGDSSSIRSL